MAQGSCDIKELGHHVILRNLVIIGSGNALSPVQCQTMTQIMLPYSIVPLFIVQKIDS